MKKTYISPSACSIRMQFQGMLATSKINIDTDSDHRGGEMMSNKREDIWGNEQKGLWD